MFPFCYSANAELCPSHSTLYLYTKKWGISYIVKGNSNFRPCKIQKICNSVIAVPSLSSCLVLLRIPKGQKELGKILLNMLAKSGKSDIIKIKNYLLDCMSEARNGNSWH